MNFPLLIGLACVVIVAFLILLLLERYFKRYRQPVQRSTIIRVRLLVGSVAILVAGALVVLAILPPAAGLLPLSSQSSAVHFAEYPGPARPTPLASSTPQVAVTLYGISTGPDGAVWFTEADGNYLGRITSNGHISEFSVPTPYPDALGI